MRGLCDGATVKFRQVELDSGRQINVHSSVTINSAVLTLELILTIR